MKLIKKIAIILMMIVIVNINTYVLAASSYFLGEAIDVKDNENIEILSNEVTIDTTTSKVKNVMLIKNTSNKEIETKVSMPIGVTDVSNTVENLSIKANEANVINLKQENDEYTFNIKIPTGTGKKIEMTYNTENNLRDAKVIKYTLEKLKGKKIKSLKVDIKISEEDVPLVTEIKPGNFTFENNTISVRYYDFTVNALTQDVIVTKDTYKNLLYGEVNRDNREISKYEEYILKNAKDIIENGIELDYKSENWRRAIR